MKRYRTACANMKNMVLFFYKVKTEDPARLAQTSRLVLVFSVRVRLTFCFHTTAVSEMLM